MYHEGYELAELLAKNGITAAVLKYRIPNPTSSNEPHLVPLSDARKALKMMHQKADVYGINTNEIGVVGFSAGSHLATVLALWQSDEPMENPDFTGLIYGVTDLNEGNRGWLESNLYHRKMTEEEVIQNTLLNLVNKDTPQAFLVHAVNDDSCRLEETTLYAQKLLTQGVLAETHIFPKGGHGFGVGAASDGTDQWVGLFVNWLKHITF
jgi:acetyl esterase/lipase